MYKLITGNQVQNDCSSSTYKATNRKLKKSCSTAEAGVVILWKSFAISNICALQLLIMTI